MNSALSPVIVNRVLVVDDDRDEAAFLKEFLQQHKMQVDIARDAGQAHSAFSMHPPDMVLLDIMLPNNVSGFEVCERMKTTEPNVPVLILSAIELDDAFDLAKRVGADGYVTKPYDPDMLLVKIRETAELVWQRGHADEESVKAEKVRFDCSECGKRLKVSGAHRGHRLNCPQCGNSLVVPRHD
ncbi:MAG: response regulator [Planctomycetaceae bacterium]